ncbi:DUF4124 domain-containing protein [Ottowia testudinis]|uniref:DUF4124 domain-containing protein n=1 Tax=Ottowia testudinis TaxID=2816950 RepID=A0A975H3E5_9BURK|nr:DUF4124 domain-containing protein [Ottowia testudinis]QTD45180.1 DUF4124 domain-containing protein [Ottowia testudinis]
MNRLLPRFAIAPSASAVRGLTAACVLAVSGGAALAQSIYTCVDAQGRRLTSDRPIMACIDREQRELNSSGTTRRVIQPTMTAAEREARDARERDAAIERQRAQNMVRRDQALATRYPDKAAHDAGRKEALAQTQSVVDAANARIAELLAERKTLDEEMEFYKKDRSKAPAKLRRGIEDNAQAVEAQQRAIAGQQDERNRINARFDEEAARLKPLWQAKAADAATAVKR